MAQAAAAAERMLAEHVNRLRARGVVDHHHLKQTRVAVLLG
jgi:hypothetical protein